MGILDKMIAIVDVEGVAKECRIRKVEAVDMHFDAESWATAKSCLGIYLEEFPKEIRKWKTYEGEEARQVSTQYDSFGEWIGHHPSEMLAFKHNFPILRCDRIHQPLQFSCTHFHSRLTFSGIRHPPR